MPTGFATNPHPPSLRSHNYFCNKPYPDTSSAGVSVEFEKGSFGPFIGETLRAYPSVAAAEQSFQEGVASAQACTTYSEKDGTQLTLSQLSYRTLGDQTFAIQIKSAGKITISADEVYFLKGNVEVGISTAGLALYPGLLQKYVPIAYNRLNNKL